MRIDVINCIMNGEIIEDYPTDYPHLSCFIFGHGTLNNRVVHVVAVYDCTNVLIITAYYPSAEKVFIRFKNEVVVFCVCFFIARKQNMVLPPIWLHLITVLLW